MSEDLFYNRDRNISGIASPSELAGLGLTPVYGSTVEFEAKNHSYVTDDFYYNLIPLSVDSLVARFSLKYQVNETNARKLANFFEAQSGYLPIEFKPDNLGIYKTVSGFCDNYAINFINNSDHSKLISQKAFSRHDFFLKTIKCHGKWDGETPFIANSEVYNEKNKIGIITRAKINKFRLFEFWSSVPTASKAIMNARGVEWCKGIGEWPLIHQATFSVWDNLESVKKFAYGSGDHSKIVQKTKKRNWYSEDLFARFEILSSDMKVF